MPHSKAAFADSVSSLYTYIHGNEVWKEREVSRLIYKVMTLRHSKNAFERMWQDYFSVKEDEFDALIDSLKFGSTVKVEEISYFTQLRMNLGPLRKKYQIGRFFVRHKLYFSVSLNGNDYEQTYERLRAFVALMPVFFRMLEGIAVQNRDDIVVKYPSDLSKLLEQADSLVVYYSRSESLATLLKVVPLFFEGHGVELVDRQLRSVQGFDMKNRHNHFIGASHSKLVANIIMKHILQNKREMLQKSYQQLVYWVTGMLLKTNRLGVGDMHAALYQEKSVAAK